MYRMSISLTAIAISVGLALAAIAVLYFALKTVAGIRGDTAEAGISLQRGLAVGATMGSAVVLGTVLLILLS